MRGLRQAARQLRFATRLEASDMSRIPLVLATALLAGLAAAGAARAQDLQGAQTPSHNIFCLASPPGDGQPTASVRCDIMQKSTRSPPAPASCPLSWGDSFGVNATGAGYLVCHGDTTSNADDPVIAYGTQWRPFGFICTSQTTGITCVNSQGHGFSVSRASQKVF
jgi:hypothetical protein